MFQKGRHWTKNFKGKFRVIILTCGNYISWVVMKGRWLENLKLEM